MNSAVEKMAKNFGTRDLVIKKVTPATGQAGDGLFGLRGERFGQAFIHGGEEGRDSHTAKDGPIASPRGHVRRAGQPSILSGAASTVR